MKRLKIAPLLLGTAASLAPALTCFAQDAPIPAAAGNVEIRTRSLPRPPNYYDLKSVKLEEKSRVTFRNRASGAINLGQLDAGGKIFFWTDGQIPANSQKICETTVGTAFRFDVPGTRDGQRYMVPDGPLDHPDERPFSQEQTINIPSSASDDRFIYNLADGEGRFTCLNGRATGYASVWKKEYQKNGEREIDYYVQVVQKDGYKVLRNLASRHTLRIQKNGQAEEAVPGTAEWRPVSGSWIDPK